MTEFVEDPNCTCELLAMGGDHFIRTFDYDTTGCIVHSDPHTNPEPGADELLLDHRAAWEADIADNHDIRWDE